MTSRDFVYWLQGHLELSEAELLTSNQLKIIRNHLNMVFLHEIDPSMGDAAHQANLTAVHDGRVPATPGKPTPTDTASPYRPPVGPGVARC